MKDKLKTFFTGASSKAMSQIETETAKAETTFVVSKSAAEALAKEWSDFNPRVPLSFLLASKKAARLKNAY